MAIIDKPCLIKNNDLANIIKDIVFGLNYDIINNNRNASFRKVYRELKKQTDIEIDLDTFSEIYKEIPESERITSDKGVDEIVSKRTKAIIDSFGTSARDTIDEVKETSPARSTANKILTVLSEMSKDKSEVVKSVSKTLQKTIEKEINRIKNKTKSTTEKKEESYDELLNRVLNENKAKIGGITEVDTIQKILDKAKQEVISNIESIKTPDGEPILSAEAEKMFNEIQDGLVNMALSSKDASTIIRNSLIESGYGKKSGDKQVVDWDKVAGNINSVNVLRENIVSSLTKKGITEKDANAIADSLKSETEDLVKSQDALDAKYNIAEAEASRIIKKAGLSSRLKVSEIAADLRKKIDERVEKEEDLDVTNLVHEVLKENGIPDTPTLVDILSSKVVVTKNVVDKIAKLVDVEGEIQPENLQKLYNVLGAKVDAKTIKELKEISKVKAQLENMQLRLSTTEGTDKLVKTKSGMENLMVIRELADKEALLIARHIAESQKGYKKGLYKFLESTSKVVGGAPAFRLVNIPNLLANTFWSGIEAQTGKLEGYAERLTGKPTTANYKGQNLRHLINRSNRYQHYANTVYGYNRGKVPELYMNPERANTSTIKNAKGAYEKVPAAFQTVLSATLSGVDALFKKPYEDQLFLDSMVKYLQKTVFEQQQGMSKRQAKTAAINEIGQILTGISPESLREQATKISKLAGKEKDEYFIRSVEEDLMKTSLMNSPYITEDVLKAVTKTAEQIASESLGQKVQRKTDAANFARWLYLLNSKSLAKEKLDEIHNDKIIELAKKGDGFGALGEQFQHQVATSLGFLFQKGIYNWAVLLTQGNPYGLARGIMRLNKANTKARWETPKEIQESLYNIGNAKAQIDRGVIGSVLGFAGFYAINSLLNSSEDTPARKKELDKMLKDPVIGRSIRAIMPPLTMALLNTTRDKDAIAKLGSFVEGMAIQPILNVASKYYDVDEMLVRAIDLVQDKDKTKVDKGLSIFGYLASNIFSTPPAHIYSANKKYIERAFGKDSKPLVKDGKFVYDIKPVKKAGNFAEAYMENAWWADFIFKSEDIKQGKQNVNLQGTSISGSSLQGESVQGNKLE